ncbi:MAG TPA: acyl-CoA dehydrogenase family protein [Acetobacteraceae bacterium]|nr:acyl-CoA dehydrogenase family protein [Acetobacteraceae bacterium]
MSFQAFRFDPPEFPDAAHQLRREVRNFLDENRSLMRPMPNGWSPEFSRKVAERGWLGMTWPKQYGGKERTAYERYVMIEEMLAAGAPVGAHWVADRQSGPNMLRFGTEEQKQFFLPKIAAGEMYFAIGMSEPDSGSDLAGTRTRAVKVDGGFRVNGSKLWTSNAHRAHYMILFCRMAEAGQEIDRHAGATQFLVDMKSPGLEIRPVHNLLGEHSFNQIFITDLFVPDDRLLGQVGAGWKQVTGELAFERSGPERFLSTFRLLVELVRAAGPDPEPGVAVAIGRLLAHLAILRRMSMSIAGMLQRGDNPNVEAAIVKDLGTSFEQETSAVARNTVPAEATLSAMDAYISTLARTTLNAPRFSIQGGTREILRGIIARGLGLR